MAKANQCMRIKGGDVGRKSDSLTCVVWTAWTTQIMTAKRSNTLCPVRPISSQDVTILTAHLIYQLTDGTTTTVLSSQVLFVCLFLVCFRVLTLGVFCIQQLTFKSMLKCPLALSQVFKHIPAMPLFGLLIVAPRLKCISEMTAWRWWDLWPVSHTFQWLCESSDLNELKTS